MVKVQSNKGLAKRIVPCLDNYCASGKIEGVVLVGKTWNIPADATLPMRKYMITENRVLDNYFF